MRPTLHDYVIKRFETTLRIEHFATAFRQIGELQINRIEELPREIEFKDGVI